VCFFINNIHALAISTIGRRFLFCHLDDFDALILNNVDDRKIFFAVSLVVSVSFCAFGSDANVLFCWKRMFIQMAKQNCNAAASIALFMLA
jgi:hypothetical protein